MSSYLKNLGPASVPQSEPLTSTQVENRAGGYVFPVDDWTRLRRFLILGTMGGTFYAGQRELARESADVVARCLSEDYIKTVEVITEVSEGGKAPRNDEAIFALVLASSHKDEMTRRFALARLPRVCRTASHLFMFLSLVEEYRGWGPALRGAVADWYITKDVDKLAYQVVKYRDRYGFTHRDALRLAHPKPEDLGPERSAVCDWVTHRTMPVGTSTPVPPELHGEPMPGMKHIEAFEKVQASISPVETAALIREYGNVIPHEALLTEHKRDPEVMEALLDAGMPMTALIRDLGRLTARGVLKPMGAYTRLVASQIQNPEAIKRSRVHPFAILTALATYRRGRGVRGTLTWNPVKDIIDALDSAFYLAFDNVESTGKRTLLALDISGSMGTPVLGSEVLTAREASAAMAMVTAAREPVHHTIAFAAGAPDTFLCPYQSAWDVRGYGSHWDTGVAPVDLSPRERLDDVVNKLSGMPAGGTDCALPMVYAQEKGIGVDTFVIYTDNETWAGEIHPIEALRQYRSAMSIDAKLVVVAMTSTEYSVADPDDAGSLDVVGFDTSAPALIADFSR